jgi:hypothetical protein
MTAINAPGGLPAKAHASERPALLDLLGPADATLVLRRLPRRLPTRRLGRFAFRARYMDQLVALDPPPGVTVTTAANPPAAPNSNAVEIDIDLLT